MLPEKHMDEQILLFFSSCFSYSPGSRVKFREVFKKYQHYLSEKGPENCLIPVSYAFFRATLRKNLVNLNEGVDIIKHRGMLYLNNVEEKVVFDKQFLDKCREDFNIKNYG